MLVQEKSRIFLNLFSIDVDLVNNPSRVYPEGFCVFVHPQHALCYKYVAAECVVIHICAGCSPDETGNTA